jgi:hypothetical protein
MADTITALQGYMAGIFRSPGVVVGAATVHNMAVNGTFATGDTTSWTETLGAGGSLTVADGYGRNGYGYGLRIVDGGGAAKTGIDQTITLASAVTATTYWAVLSGWVKFAVTGKTATMKITTNTVAPAVLDTATVAIKSNNIYYGDTNWGYFSVWVACDATTKSIKIEIYSDTAGAAQTFYVDDIQCVIVDQCAGAYGDMTLNDNVDIIDATTFATSTNAFRTTLPAMHNLATVALTSYFTTSEIMASKMYADTKFFCTIFSQRGTKTSDRFEFWGRISGANFSTPLAGIQQENVTITVDGVIGQADI